MHSVGFFILLFIIFALLLGALLKSVMRDSKIPYTVALLLFGFGIGIASHLGWFSSNHLITSSLAHIGSIDPHLILFLFLPTLIFESAYSMEPHLFFRILPQIALLAIVGLIISMVLSAFAISYLMSWGIGISLLFGAIISATDPVAVVALLKEKSSRKRLETLIEGESLLNDGTAIVFFALFYGFAVGATVESSFITLGGEFIWVILAGIAIGLLVGWSSLWVIGKLIDAPLIEITISVASAYLTFIVAESLHVSGVISLVSLALIYSTLGRTRISPEISHFLHQFWEMLAYIANTIIFLIVGIVVMMNAKLDDTQLWITLFILYIALVLIRSISVIILMPILDKIGVGITKQKATVLVWGGLRGAVSLSLALSVAQDPDVPKALGEQILFLTAGIVFLTIVINGSTMEALLKFLKLDKFPPAKEASIKKAQRALGVEMQEYFKTITDDIFFNKLEKDSLDTLVEVYTNNATTKDNLEKEDEDMAFMRRLLEIERSDYWKQFEDGNIGRQATFLLSKSVESALDNAPTIYPRKHLDEILQIPTPPKWLTTIPFMSHFFDRWLFRHLSLRYDIIRGFVKAQEEIELHIDSLKPSEMVGDEAIEMVSKNNMQAFAFTNQLRMIYPELVQKIQLSSAKRLLLNRERSLVWKMQHDGVLELSEAQHLIDKIEKQMRG